MRRHRGLTIAHLERVLARSRRAAHRERWCRAMGYTEAAERWFRRRLFYATRALQLLEAMRRQP
jgi:hypothetical protein